MLVIASSTTATGRIPVLSYPAPSRSASEVSSSVPGRDVRVERHDAAGARAPRRRPRRHRLRLRRRRRRRRVVVVVAVDDSIGTSCRGSTSTFDCLRCLSRCGLWWSRGVGGGARAAARRGGVRRGGDAPSRWSRSRSSSSSSSFDAERRASASAVSARDRHPEEAAGEEDLRRSRASRSRSWTTSSRARGGQIPAERMRGRRGCRQLLPVGSREGSGRTPSRAAAPPRRVRRVPARSSDAPRLRRGVEDIARAVRSGRCDADGGAATRVTQPLDFLKLSRCLNGTGGSRQKTTTTSPRLPLLPPPPAI